MKMKTPTLIAALAIVLAATAAHAPPIERSGE